MGKGDKALFWNDTWLDGGCFMDRFPRIFGIATNKTTRVEEMWCWDGGVGMWNVMGGKQV